MAAFILSFLVLAFGLPVAVLLALPYPIKLALKIVWKTYCIIAAIMLAKWMLAPMWSGVDYITNGKASLWLSSITGVMWFVIVVPTIFLSATLYIKSS